MNGMRLENAATDEYDCCPMNRYAMDTIRLVTPRLVMKRTKITRRSSVLRISIPGIRMPAIKILKPVKNAFGGSAPDSFPHDDTRSLQGGNEAGRKDLSAYCCS